MTYSGGYARRTKLPFIPAEGWREEAACRFDEGTPFEPLWDDRVDDESDKQRKARHERAKLVCNHQCPVRQKCSDDTDYKTDEGIRGGHKIPSLDLHRTDQEQEMLRLLRKGWTLDEAARGARRPPPRRETA